MLLINDQNKFFRLHSHSIGKFQTSEEEEGPGSVSYASDRIGECYWYE